MELVIQQTTMQSSAWPKSLACRWTTSNQPGCKCSSNSNNNKAVVCRAYQESQRVRPSCLTRHSPTCTPTWSNWSPPACQSERPTIRDFPETTTYSLILHPSTCHHWPQNPPTQNVILYTTARPRIYIRIYPIKPRATSYKIPPLCSQFSGRRISGAHANIVWKFLVMASSLGSHLGRFPPLAFTTLLECIFLLLFH